MKRYKTESTSIIYFLLIIGLLFPLVILTDYKNPSWTFEWWASLSGAWLLFLFIASLFPAKFTHLILEKDKVLKFVSMLFVRKTILVHHITEINRQPTFQVLKGKIKSTYIFYESDIEQGNSLTTWLQSVFIDSGHAGNIKWIELRHSMFSEATIGNLISDLVRINPKIKLDSYCTKLVKSIKPNKN